MEPVKRLYFGAIQFLSLKNNVVLYPQTKHMKVKRYLLFGFILLLISNLSLAQTETASFSKRIEEAYSDPNVQIQNLLDSADYYLVENRDKAFIFLEQAYLLSLVPENQEQQYLVTLKLGHFYEFYEQADLAAINYEKSLQGLENNQSEQFKYMLKAGQQYELARQAPKSLQLYHPFVVESSTIDQLYLKEAMGDAYYQLNLMDSAYLFYSQAEAISAQLQLDEENTLLKLKLAKILSSRNDSMAYVLLNTANAQSKSSGSRKLQIKTESNLADYYKQRNQDEKEIGSRNSIIENLVSNRAELESMDVDVESKKLEEQINIAKTYNKQTKYDDALDILSEQTATPSSEDDPIQLELKKEVAKTRSEAYLKSGQEQEALKSYEEYVLLLDELYLQKEMEYQDVKEMSSKLSDHQYRIDFLEKDKAIYDAELILLEQERKMQSEEMRFKNWYIILLAILMSVLVFALIMMYQRYKIQRKHNLQLDLKALRTQMNPHFIFNALNSVNSFIAKNDELNANKYLVRFSTLMRSILDNSEMDFIPLKKEIEILELYLQLENMRFSDKFSFNFSIDPKVDVDHFEIPPMLIQPYIENAIWHGLRYKEDEGILNVSLETDGNGLKVVIEDNGIGRTKSMELKTKSQKVNKPKGIKNTTKRLEILGKIYHQEIKQQIEDLKANGEGTRVSLCIPNLNKSS